MKNDNLVTETSSDGGSAEGAKAITVTFPPFLKLVPPVRQLASRFARLGGYSTKDAFRIETIVDEVCNNAVDHGQSGVESKVEMHMAVDREKADISVTNQSDPKKVAVLKELVGRIGQANHVGNDDRRGRGLALIRMLSSNMDVNITDHGTSVHVTKLREG
ncbi:MAG: ATP-binding protein [Chitinispirillales bacterium]|nr:ATP-binding protein [Chitinispirillales bacterium]